MSGAQIYERSRVSVAVEAQWDSFFSFSSFSFFLLMNEKSQTAVRPRDGLLELHSWLSWPQRAQSHSSVLCVSSVKQKFSFFHQVY